jgi:alkanesulfonate monooxygenase SsuD/methylene tetrahydromethanopterin reductase-like flavin-dependent oxidoreductase (luciferase family)
MIGATRRLHFTNNIYIAGNRPILVVAKQVATAAVLSDNRVELGVAAGWMREEFELNGQRWENRGRRLDEMIQALRVLWQPGWVEWHGEHYDIPAVTLEPHPPQPVPIYTGGHTDAALKRAARYADGWIGNAYPWAEAEHHVGRLKKFLAEEGRDGADFDIICGLYEMPAIDMYRRAEEELGITGTMCMPWALGNVSKGDRRNLNDVASAYQSYIDQFAEAIVLPLRR